MNCEFSLNKIPEVIFMPRSARVKPLDSMFHVMVRSISEIKLFKTDKDKIKYFNLVKKYQDIYHFKVYAYCLMGNHGHFIIDANGADISKFMHGINLSYAKYFNRVHNRHGHLFQDRFKSKVITNEKYLYTLSAYIHNNPSDLQGYKTRVEKYNFSSLSVYLNLRKDPFDVLDYNFIHTVFGFKMINPDIDYLNFVHECNQFQFKSEIEFSEESSEYISCRNPLLRNFEEEFVIDFVAKKTNIDKHMFHAKHSRTLINSRAILALLMRSFCDSKCSDICNILGNITQSRVSSLSSYGLKLVSDTGEYRHLVDEFIKRYSYR